MATPSLAPCEAIALFYCYNLTLYGPILYVLTDDIAVALSTARVLGYPLKGMAVSTLKVVLLPPITTIDSLH